MKFFSLVAVVCSLALSSCATMSAEEKGQYLEQYRAVSKRRMASMLDGPNGMLAGLKNLVMKNASSPAEGKLLNEGLMSGKFGVTIDEVKEDMVDADMRAIDESFTGKQIKYLVDFYNSAEGKVYVRRADESRKQLYDELFANPDSSKESIQRFQARSLEIEKSISQYFSTGVGASIAARRKQYLARTKRYRADARKRFVQKAKKALDKRFKKNSKAH